MAAKILLLVLAMSAAVVFADNNCDCDNDADREALWDFLASLSKDFKDLAEEDKDMYSVPPGFLSPLFDCNCLEKSRRKREITREANTSDESLSMESKIKRVRALRERKSIHYGSRHCPAGYARIGVLCIEEEYID